MLAYNIFVKPWLDFIRVMNRFFVLASSVGVIYPTAIVEDGAEIGLNVQIAPPLRYIGAKRNRR